MDGDTIRALRRRLGLTQAQLAEATQVDQGTVSRWERGIETPRASRQAELQRLLLRDEGNRIMQRSLAIVRQNYLPASFLDHRLRLLEISASGKRYFRAAGRQPESLIGVDFERYAERLGVVPLHQALVESGLLTGDVLLFRFVASNGGKAHATVYEPVFADGSLAGVLNYIAASFPLPHRPGPSVELVEVVRTDDPSRAIQILRGPLADQALRALDGT